MGLQRGAVIVDAVEHDGRHGKNDPRRSEFPFGENVMDQAAVQTAVAVLERVHMDEAERGGGRLQNRIDSVIAHAVIGFQHARHQVGEVLRARADKLRQWIAGVVAIAEEHAVGAQARLHEARVLDEDAVKPDDFVEREPVLPRLQDGAAPSLQPVARRPFAFNLETRAAVGE